MLPDPQRIAALVRACSIELSPHDRMAGAPLQDLFPAGTTVFVNAPPSVTPPEQIYACARLQRAGFIAVPHVLARTCRDFTAASDLLQRLAQEAGVTQILLLGGDAAQPAGPFASALSLLATGLVERHGIDTVAFAGYPEGHRHIDAANLQAALQAKLELARQRDLQSMLVTQFAFEAAPILRWLATVRFAGAACPIRIGLAGPASVAALARYAVRCGIGTSLRALTQGHAAIARIVGEGTPDRLIAALVAAENAAAPIDGLHLFAFGGARRTAAWRAGVLTDDRTQA
jgi:methylenetetrahydrofolate reductase (NADPH)